MMTGWRVPLPTMLSVNATTMLMLISSRLLCWLMEGAPGKATTRTTEEAGAGRLAGCLGRLP
jgi:hypothetical protein